MDVGFRALTVDDFETVHAAFVEAFSDYVVTLAPTREQLLEMLTRRAYVPETSVGVFDGERMVAFTLNGVDGAMAYDTGTGVVPSHRRQGLGLAMMDHVVRTLRARGCTRYLLEVIDTNTAAISLYRSQQFVETRGLQCWSYPASNDDESLTLSERDIHDEWCDVAPSWQNSTASIRRARQPHLTVGNDDGYVVLFPATGDVPQLAVRPEARRRGAGTLLLRQAAARSSAPLRIVNVDDGAAGIGAFLTAAGATRTVRQLEMIRPL
jgi:ribosomal protein S18 acetylase RimI-like enzyme